MINLNDRNESEPGLIGRIFRESKTIAVIGLSPNTHRPSYMVADYMQASGYRIIPVNPGQNSILEENCYPDLDSIPKEITIDVVDVFRSPEYAMAAVEAAIKRGVRFIWLQDGVVSKEAWDLAAKHHIPIVMNDCMYRQGMHYM